jgi:hypothetical protein
MVLDDLSSRERYGLVAAFAVAVVASGSVGFLGANSSSPTGAFTGSSVSTDDVKSTVQSLMDRQVSRQQQQLSVVAQKNENISREDVSIQAEVETVEESEFPSLYRVTVSSTGQVPNQSGEIQSIDEEQVYYVSKDGRYLFQEPTDLQEQQQQPTAGQ